MHQHKQKIQRKKESQKAYENYMELENKHMPRDIISERSVTPASVSKFTEKGKQYQIFLSKN
jgi:hypothetical protein